MIGYIKEIETTHDECGIAKQEIYLDNKLLTYAVGSFQVGEIFRYINNKYIVVRVNKYSSYAEKDKIYIELLEEYEKRKTMVNLDCNYIRLSELEETLIELYGYRLEKVERKIND